MFMILWVGNSGRHQRVRQGTEEVALLLWSLCLGLVTLERLGWDCVSEASHRLCVASVGAEKPRWLLYSHVRPLSWDGWAGIWAGMACSLFGLPQNVAVSGYIVQLPAWHWLPRVSTAS